MKKTIEISLRYASSVQDTMRDLVRLLSTEENGLCQDSSNTLTYEYDSDEYDEVGYDIAEALKATGVPDDEIYYSEQNEY